MKLELFNKNTDPKLINTDYHIHTTHSDGTNTPEEYVKKAISFGLKEIAFTDHVWKTSNWIDDYVKEIKMLREKYPQIKILIGIEAKALNRKGEIDASENTIKKVDFVMGVCHENLPLEEAPNNKISNLTPEKAAEIEAEVTMGLLENKNVDVIGHPGRTYYKFFHDTGKTKEEYPQELFLKMIKKAKEIGKPLEYNTRLPFSEKFLRLLVREDCPFTIGSDAHSVENIGKIDYDKIIEVMKNS